MRHAHHGHGPGDAPDGMTWAASSSDASIATVRIVGAFLLIDSEPASEGTAQITLVATDALGLRATVRFEVRVEFHWPHAPSRGWRSILGNPTPNAEASSDAPASPAPPPTARQ